jgi:hypothetical protein
MINQSHVLSIGTCHCRVLRTERGVLCRKVDCFSFCVVLCCVVLVLLSLVSFSAYEPPDKLVSNRERKPVCTARGFRSNAMVVVALGSCIGRL